MKAMSVMRVTHALFVTLVVYLFGFSSIAYSGEKNPKLLSTPRQTSFQGVIETPMDFSTKQPIVEVMINGEGPFRLVVDTGSRYTILDDDLRRKIKVREWREVSFEVGDPILVVGVASFSINGAVFSSFEALMIDYDEIHGGKRMYDGIIGFPLFKDILLTLDYPSQRMLMEKGEIASADERQTLTYLDYDGLAMVNFQFRITTIDAIVGSGNISAFALAEDRKGNVFLQSTRSSRRPNTKGISGIFPVPGKATIRFGQYALTRPPIHFFGEESYVGSEVLKHFKITFDQKTKRVRFLREETGPIDFVVPPRYGMLIKLRGNKFVVEKIYPGSAATKVGVSVGDVLTYIGGKSAHQYNEQALHFLLETEDSIVMKMEKPGGFPFIFRIDVEDIPKEN